MEQPIYLIGFMGSGKSTFGKLLAETLHYQFTDMDHFLEQEQKASISELFERYGETGFRELEKDALKQTTHHPRQVVATGGGAPCFFNNMELMNKQGITIYLKLQPEDLAKRLLPGMNHRPLIAGKSEAELLAFIKSKLSERSAYYEEAQITIDNSGLTPADTVRIALKALT